MWYINTKEYYSAIKKEWNFAICNNMDGPEGIMLRELSETKKDKYYIFSLICWLYKIKQMKEYNKTETDSEI